VTKILAHNFVEILLFYFAAQFLTPFIKDFEKTLKGLSHEIFNHCFFSSKNNVITQSFALGVETTRSKSKETSISIRRKKLSRRKGEYNIGNENVVKI